jgi:magnesium transporter
MALYAFTLIQENIEEIPIDKIKKSYKTVWIRAIAPNTNEIKTLSELTSAPVEEFKEFLEQDERPRLEINKYLQVIFRAPILADGEIITTPINMFINNNLVVTVEKQHTKTLDKFHELVSVRKGRFLFRHNPAYFLFHTLDKINDEFLVNIDKIANTLDIFERSASSSLTKESVEKIYEKSVILTVFNQSLISNIEVLNSLRKTYSKLISSINRRQFNDLYYEALQILDTEKIQRDVIANLFNIQAIIASNKMNNLIKHLTAITLIFMIPSAISGIYGMNFKYIPLAESQYGFIIITFIILFLAIIAFFWFKILEWL